MIHIGTNGENIMAGKYGIRITHSNGSTGWVAGKDCKVLLFRTKPEATKALKQMKNDQHYSWKCEAEVMEFTAFKK